MNAIRLNNGRIEITFAYDPDLIPVVKGIAARWDGQARTWWVEKSQAGRAVSFSLSTGIPITQEVANLASQEAVEEDKEAEYAEKRAVDHRLFKHQCEGIRWLARNERGILADQMGLGKAHPVDSLILTPTGWKAIGELSVGDEVIGSDGKPTKVTGVFPQGEKDIFECEFTDKTRVTCCDEHLWTVNTPYRRWAGCPPRTKSLKEIRERLVDGAGNNQHFLPMLSAPVEFAAGDPLPLNPWTLGALLGDGSMTTNNVKYTNKFDMDLLAKLQNSLPDGDQLRRYASSDKDYVIEPDDGRAPRESAITKILDNLGLLGCRSAAKFIPEPYLFAPASDRLALLQGLLDTDGEVREEDGHVQFSSTSKQLAEGVAHLVRSLGGTARIRQLTQFYEDGESPADARTWKQGNEYTCWHVTIAMPDGIIPVTIERKLANLRPREKYKPAKAFKNVVHIGTAECVCISVDAEDCLYVADGFTLTHNTIEALMALPDNARAIVVCPKSLKGNWKNEIKIWRKDLKPSILSGRNSFRWPAEGEIVIINYNILTHPDDLADAPEGVNLICDEAQYIKNRNAQRFKNCKAVSDQCKRVWYLTGTPLLNRPMELWNLLNGLQAERKAFGGWNGFKRAFGMHKNSWGGWVHGKTDPSVPFKLRNVMLRRERKDVLDLPEKWFSDIPVNDLDAGLVKQMDELIEQWDKEIGSSTEEQIEALENGEITLEEFKELQALNINNLYKAFVFEEIARLRALVATAKIPSMMELVGQHEDSDEPLIVFSAHRSPIDKLEGRDGWKTIHGGVSAEKRQDIVSDFQAGKLKGVALTIGAGNTGLTLTHACRMVFVDLDWTPANNEQAEDRIMRIGQKNNCEYIHLVADHLFDQRIHAILSDKRQLINDTVEKATVIEAKTLTEKLDGVNVISDADLAKQVKAVKAKKNSLVRARDGETYPEAKAVIVRDALLTLAGMCDGAVRRDDVGFNGRDSGFGKSLAKQVMSKGSLSVKQWEAGERMVYKYHRQINDLVEKLKAINKSESK